MEELTESEGAAVRVIVDRMVLDVVGVFSFDTVERFVAGPSPNWPKRPPSRTTSRC